MYLSIPFWSITGNTYIAKVQTEPYESKGNRILNGLFQCKTPIFEPLFPQISLPKFIILQNESCIPDVSLKLFFQKHPQFRPLTWSKLPQNKAGSGRFSQLQTRLFKTWALQCTFLQKFSLYFQISQNKSCRFHIYIQLLFKTHLSILPLKHPDFTLKQGTEWTNHSVSSEPSKYNPMLHFDPYFNHSNLIYDTQSLL